MRRSTFQWKQGVFSEKGGGNSVNEGFGKDFYRKGNSVKSSGPFGEPPDSEKWKVAVLIPFPKSALSFFVSSSSLPFLSCAPLVTQQDWTACRGTGVAIPHALCFSGCRNSIAAIPKRAYFSKQRRSARGDVALNLGVFGVSVWRAIG